MELLLKIIFVLFTSILISKAETKKRVLHIISYNSSFPTFEAQVHGVRDSLSDIAYVDIEFMDSKRFPSKEHQKNFYQLLKYKVTHSKKYDLILTSDDNALNFTLKYREVLFRDIPIVFFGVNNSKLAKEQNLNPKVTGVIEDLTMRDTLSLSRDLNPDAKRVYALVDNSTTAKADLERFYRLKESFSNLEFKHLNLSEYSFENFLKELHKLPKDSITLWIASWRDLNRENISLYRALSNFSKSLNVPIYHMYKQGIGYGVLGGRVVSHREQAKIAGKIAREILENRVDISSIKVIEQSPNLYMIDYQVAKRFHIDLEKLPKNTVFVNEDDRIREDFSEFIINSFYTMLGLFIISILYLVFKLNSSKIELLKQTIHLKKFIKSLPIALLVHSKGKILYVNLNFKNLLGYSESENLNSKDVLDFIDKSGHKIAKKRMELSYYLNSNNKVIEYNFIKKDGSRVWVEARANIINYNGEDAIVSTFVDMDSRKRYELMLENFNRALKREIQTQLNEKLKAQREKIESEELLIQQSKLAQMGEMIGAISHQLKQPLNIISLQIQSLSLLYQKGVSQSKFDAKVESIFETIFHMSSTIDDFRLFLKPSKVKESFSIYQSIDGVKSLISEQLKVHNIEVKISDIEDFKVLGYENEFKHVILNILSNAKDLFIEQNLDGKILIDIFRDRNFGVIEILDNAGGIEQTLLPDKLFEPYTTTKGDEGTGIGLNMSKVIIEKNMGGKIFAKNYQDGALFRIELPI